MDSLFCSRYTSLRLRVKQLLRHNNVRVQLANRFVNTRWPSCISSLYRVYVIIRVAEIVTLTLAPQKWHIPPRTQGFACRQMSDITIVKPTAPVTDTPPTKRRRCDGVQHIQPREHSVERAPGEGAIVADIASS